MRFPTAIVHVLKLGLLITNLFLKFFYLELICTGFPSSPIRLIVRDDLSLERDFQEVYRYMY